MYIHIQIYINIDNVLYFQSSYACSGQAKQTNSSAYGVSYQNEDAL